MVKAGVEEINWEPYTGNKPSPSPDYTQEIINAGDDGSIDIYSSVGGRNLAEKTNQGVTNWTWSMQSGDFSKTEVVEDGIRCCKLERGSIAQNGWSVICYNDIGRNKLEAGEQYAVSFEVKGSVSGTFVSNRVRLVTAGGMSDLTQKQLRQT